MKTIKTASALVAVLMIVVLASCEYLPEKIKKIICPPEPMPKNIIVLADYSASIPRATTDWYLATIADEIIPTLGKNDNLTILPVDYGSLTSSKEVFSTNFDKLTFSTAQVNELQKKSFEQQQFLKFKKDSILPGLKTAFETAYHERSKYNKGTDLLGAMVQAHGYLKNGSQNLVVIMSDMIQETELVNIEKHMKADNQVETMLNKTQKVQLHDVEVIILTGEQPNISISKFNRIKTYWEKLAERDDWNLLEYNSGGRQALRNWLKDNNDNGK